jgi:hypothetical protein
MGCGARDCFLSIGAANLFSLLIMSQQQIHRRHNKQGERCTDGNAGGNHQTHVVTARRPGAGCKYQGQHTQHHDHALVFAIALQVVGELHDEDTMLADKTNECYQFHLGIDV